MDNSVDRPPYTHGLKDKPHGLVPLDYEVPLDMVSSSDPVVAAGQLKEATRLRRHPYYYETSHLPYPTSMFMTAAPIPPLPIDETEAEWVDTPEALGAMVEDLKVAKEIAMDLEHHNLRSYYGFTCLIQISTREKDWILDALKLRKELKEGKLGGVLVDPTIIKVSFTVKT